MPTPNLNQFSLQGLLLVLTGASMACALGAAGGRYWFLFGSLMLRSIVAIWCGFRWAIHGTGYWPAGTIGRMLFLLMLVWMPVAVIVLTKAASLGLEKQPIWFRP